MGCWVGAQFTEERARERERAVSGLATWLQTYGILLYYPSTFTTNQNDDLYSKLLASRREMGSCITPPKPLKVDTSDSAAL